MGTLRAQIYEEFRQFVWNCLHKKASHCAVFAFFVFKWGEYKTRPDAAMVTYFFFDFIQWKPTDTWPRDRCGRAQLVLLPSLADFLHLGADL